MPPACDELTFRLYVPNTFHKIGHFGHQSRARLLRTFGFGAADVIVRNDEVVGSIPTSSTISQQLTSTDLADYVPQRSNSVRYFWLFDAFFLSFSMAIGCSTALCCASGPYREQISIVGPQLRE